jgi:hypothetical protein
MRHLTLLLATALAITSTVAASAQSTSTTSTTAAPETTGKMKDECESRKNDQAAAGAETVSGTKLSESSEKKEMTSDAADPRERKMAALSRDAEDKNKEIVENTKTAPDGSKVAATGPAKPVENWFGCPPEKDKDGPAKTQ